MLCCPECLLGFRRFKVAPPEPARLVAVEVAPASAGRRWLDVHCHVFNAADLPVADFIDHTRLSGAGRVLAFPVLAIIAALYQHAIISATDEIRILNGEQTAPLIGSATVSKLDALYAMQGRTRPGAAPALTTATRHIPPMRNGARLLQDALHEQDPTRPADQPLTDQEQAMLAAQLEADAANPANDYDWLHWIDLLAQQRDVIVGDLLDQFAPNADVMITPALVDYNRWLGIGAAQDGELTSVDDQITVMAAIATYRSSANLPGGTRRCLMSSFAPFDPWRSIEDDTVLPRLRTWLEQGRALGAKIYPPMGFMALGNDSSDAPAPPDALSQLVQQRRPGQTVGAALDDELRKLYALCSALDAPIMTHCASTQLAEPDNAMLPSPAHWRKVCEEFPQLRVNLGHIGGVWAFAPTDSEGQAQTNLAKSWGTEIAALMHDFENVYADIAFFDLALVDTVVPGSPSALALEFIANLAQRYSVLPKRLMYGSDWIMVGQLTAGNDYARRVEQSMSQIFRDDAAMEDFRWRNAARYLGLGASDRTRARLTAFLGENAGLLNRFDPDA